MKPVLALLFCCLLLTACRHVEEGRFLVDARINDKPVRLAYDTGAESTVLFNKTVKRLGLKGGRSPSGKPPPGKVMIGETGLCQLKLGPDAYMLKLATIHLPWWWGLDVDGVIGWPDLMDDFIAIDTTTASLKGLDKLPEETAGWLKLPLYSHTGVLALEIPRADGKVGVVEIDTGNSEGVSLSPERWNEWRKTHPHSKKGWTLDIMPGSGAVLGRKYQADALALGPIMFTNVPVRKANITERAIAGDAGVYEGSVGFKALQRMNFIVDRKNNVAYLQPKSAMTNEPSRSTPRRAVASTNSTVHLRFREYEYFDRGMDELDSHQYADAIADYQRFLKLSPTNAWILACCGEARYMLAAVQGNTKELNQALGELDRGLELNPKIVRAYFARGNARYLARQWPGALQDYRHLCEVVPRETSYSRFFIWLIRAQSGEQTAADQELSAALKQQINSDYGPWQAKVGDFLLGRLSEADFLHAANARDTGVQCEAWFYAGFKRRLAGDRIMAKNYFQKCVATERKDFFEYGFAVAELKGLD